MGDLIAASVVAGIIVGLVLERTMLDHHPAVVEGETIVEGHAAVIEAGRIIYRATH